MTDTSKLQPHQQRVVDELKELRSKTVKLELFTCGDLFDELPLPERYLLENQLFVMMTYSKILSQRISLFNN